MERNEIDNMIDVIKEQIKILLDKTLDFSTIQAIENRVSILKTFKSIKSSESLHREAAKMSTLTAPEASGASLLPSNENITTEAINKNRP